MQQFSDLDPPEPARIHYTRNQNRENLHRELPRRYNPSSSRRPDMVDQPPNLSFYSNFLTMGKTKTRPTLQELRNNPYAKALTADKLSASLSTLVSISNGSHHSKDTLVSSGALDYDRPKFGWIQGVLIRCFLNIIGVMLYLRITWLTAHAGIGIGTGIVLLSSLVTTITCLSMCAICTNGEVRGGGAYFLISRSLGPEFGGSIGIVFSFANAAAVAMHTVGFAETVKDLLKERNVVFLDSMEDGGNVIRVVGLGAVTLLLAITQIGMAWEAKAQNFFLVTLLVSVVDYVAGTFMTPSPQQRAKGFMGYSGQIFRDNFPPAWRGQDFFSVFGVYFPAATGILAGANISGDLKDPSHDIPKGTLLAILTSSLLYGSFIWFSGASVIRDASGSLADLYAGTLTSCVANGTEGCRYGLYNYFQTCEMQAAFGPLVTAGIFAATLSSALAALVSSPKLFQAVCKDRLFPYIAMFGKGYGKSEEPRLSYLLAYVIACLMILMGSLNAIAPIISNFFLATYGLINFATFDASFADSPGFRPSFKYYNKWLSLFGAILCVAGMFVINWWTALITFALIAAIYFYLSRRRPDVNWGSSSQARIYRSALKSMLKLQEVDEHVKNYRPQVLCLTGNPSLRPALLDFVTSITSKRCLLICGHVILAPPERKNARKITTLREEILRYFTEKDINAFYEPIVDNTLRQGIRDLIFKSGMGKLRPNVILFGFKSDWQRSDKAEVQDYFNMIHDSFESNLAVCILRSSNGLSLSTSSEVSKSSPDSGNPPDQGYSSSDPSIPPPHTPVYTVPTPPVYESASQFSSNLSLLNASKVYVQQDSLSSIKSFSINNELKGPGFPKPDGKRHKSPIMDFLRHLSRSQALSHASSTTQFSQPIKDGRIDVWWLYDDGGLTLLLPYMLSQSKSYLKGAKLRVFTCLGQSGNIEKETETLALLLHKFRIQVEEVHVVDMEDPSPESVYEFAELVSPHKNFDTSGDGGPQMFELLRGGAVSDAELSRLVTETKQVIRTRELLLQHSKDASLIVLTLTVPRKGGCSAALYLAWLDFMTRDMPPVLMVRGNQDSVLTFYS